jgi:MFS family permease
MNKRLFISGLVIWAVATVALRFAGQHVLRPGDWRSTLLLFALSFPLMALLARGLCRRFQLPPEQWLAGAVSLALPTLILDPFSSAFFGEVFPNMAPQLAGVFGGWMLCCCAGAIAGALLGQPKTS